MDQELPAGEPELGQVPEQPGLRADTPSPVPPSRWQRRGLIIRRVLTAGVVTGLVLAIFGQVVRDRTLVLGYLFFLPLIPLALWAVVQDLVCAGRCLPWGRFTLAGFGTLAALAGAFLELGHGPETDTPPSGQSVRLLHWNVKWGGIRGGGVRNEQNWKSLLSDLDAHSPDIVVLSEAPPREDPDKTRMERERGWVTDTVQEHHWNRVQCEHTPESPWWYRMVVCSRFSLVKEWEQAVTNGYVMGVVVNSDVGPLRLLVVDGRSNVLNASRTPMLNDLAALCLEGAKQGKPIDVLVGDFNTPGRCVGFDQFATLAGGYDLGARYSRGWKATWPAVCPLYDIDHVWVHKRLLLRNCAMITNLGTDHRGQVVEFGLP